MALAAAVPWRLELFIKEAAQIPGTASFLAANRIRRVNIPNKNRNEPMLDVAREVVDRYAEAVAASQGPHHALDVCPHFSLKNQWVRTEAATVESLRDFAHASGRLGCSSVLVVSGGNHKKACTAEVLHQLAASGGLREGSSRLHCAYNPYFPDEEDRQQERESLKRKLQSGLCSGLWMQIGSDVCRLRSELEHIRQLEAEMGHKLDLYGSIFLPSKQLLAQQRFRPWKGVFLSHEYLNNLEVAESITMQTIAAYQCFGVTTLVETNVKNEKDLMRVQQMFEGALRLCRQPLADERQERDQEATLQELCAASILENTRETKSNVGRAALVERYQQLTKATLPQLARENKWPIRFDHCFMRVVLDNSFEDCWYNHLDKKAGALKTISTDKLKVAVQLAESMAADESGECTRRLNARSLSWRGKKGTKR